MLRSRIQLLKLRINLRLRGLQLLNLYNMSFGQLSNTFGITLNERSWYHVIHDTILFSSGNDRTIGAKVGLWGLPSELVEKTVGEGICFEAALLICRSAHTLWLNLDQSRIKMMQ